MHTGDKWVLDPQLSFICLSFCAYLESFCPKILDQASYLLDQVSHSLQSSTFWIFGKKSESTWSLMLDRVLFLLNQAFYGAGVLGLLLIGPKAIKVLFAHYAYSIDHPWPCSWQKNISFGILANLSLWLIHKTNSHMIGGNIPIFHHTSIP